VPIDVSGYSVYLTRLTFDAAELQQFVRGLDGPELARAAASRHQIMIAWRVAEDPRFEQMRRALQLVVELAAERGGWAAGRDRPPSLWRRGLEEVPDRRAVTAPTPPAT
jgi:hypothetical protein